MRKYEEKTGLSIDDRSYWRQEPPKYYLNVEKVYYNTPKVKITYIEDTWYMEDYKKNISLSERYIKEKDKNDIKDLKERLKKQ